MSGRHVLFLGDPTELGWMRPILRACRDKLSTATLGAPGDTSVDLLERWTDYYPLAHLRIVNDPRAVISFGVNDAAGAEGPRRVTDRRSAKLLGILLDEMIHEGINAFVVGPAPVSDPEHRARIQQLSIDFAPICEERQVPYVSVFQGLLDSPSWMADFERGERTDPGYEAFAQLLLEAGLVDWLSRPVALPQGLPTKRHHDQAAGSYRHKPPDEPT